MTPKIGTVLHFIAAAALAVCFGTTTGRAQAPQPAIPSPQAIPKNAPVLPTSLAVKAAKKTLKAPAMLSPYDRIMAPPFAQWMKGKNIAMPGAGARSGSARSKANATRAAAGAANGAVNFPGFVSAPFLTLNDGSGAAVAVGVSGDFNHDGKADVAIVKFDGTIDVILSPGPGIASQKPIVSSLGSTLYGMTIAQVLVADMNGDGIPDLVGLDPVNQQIVVWISNGDGTFAPPHFSPSPLPSGSAAFALAVGDFNGDGAMDVVALSYQSFDVAVPYTTVQVQTFLNDGSGILAPMRAQQSTLNDYFSANYGQAVTTTNAAGAATGIVFPMFDTGFSINFASGVDLLAISSNGDGTFSPVVAPALPLIDDDADGTNGAIVATNLTAKGPNQPTTDIVFCTLDGAIWDTPFTSGNPTTANILVGANLWPGQLNGTGTPAPTSFNGEVDANADGVNVADMNGDGFQDLVVYAGPGIIIYTNDGTGKFNAAPTQLSGVPGVFGLQTEPPPANYDGSGYNSLVDYDGYLGVVGYFQNRGAAASVQGGQFQGGTLPTGTDTTLNAELLGSSFNLFATGDINGDGIEDVIGQSQVAVDPQAYSTNGLVFGLSNGSGPGNQSSNYTFTEVTNGTDANGNPWYGNGNHQIGFVQPVTFLNPAGTRMVLVNSVVSGNATTINDLFLIPVGKDGKSLQPQDLNFGPIALNCQLSYADVGDVNGDGITDIVVAYPGCGGQDYPSGVFTLLGNPDGSFQTATFTPLGQYLYKVKLINFTGAAGRLDIAANDYDLADNPLDPAFNLYVLPNKGDGSGTFDLTKLTIPLKNYWIADIVAGDYNVDGHQDLTLLTLGEWDGVTENLTPGTVGVVLLPGNGDYTFGPAGLAASGIYATSGKYADFNGDGMPDLVITAFASDFTPTSYNLTPLVQVLPNQGGGTFAAPIAEFSSWDANSSGTQTFVGKFSSSGGPDLLMQSAWSEPELLVNLGVTELALAASSTTPAQGVPVTLTATLSQVVSAGVAPTGTVSFTLNGTLLGSAMPVNGVATFTASSLPVGADTITATFAGDANHNQASSSLTVTVAPVMPSFSLSSATPSLSLAQGANGSVLVTVAGNSTFNGVVQLTCTGAPAEVSCTPSPATITLGPGQSGNASILIVTTPPNNSNQASTVPLGGMSGAALGGISLAGVIFVLWPGRRRLPRLLSMILVAALASTSFGALTGCSGSGYKYPGTVTGNYTLTVTAVSGSITQTQSIALTVTAPNQ